MERGAYNGLQYNIYWVYTIMLNDGVPVNAEWIMQKLQQI